MLMDFVTYLVCMWFGAGLGVLATALCVAGSNHREIVRRGRQRWWR